jgi:fatty acid synthase subunit alpha
VDYRIETQDVIFGLKNAKRVVEIGPGDTLRVMAQRTLAAKYDAYDAAHSIQRQVLTLAKDEKEICYEVDSVKENPRETSTSILSLSKARPLSRLLLAAAVTNQKAPPIADAAMTATDVVRAVIAHKLKKPLPAVSLSESIKILVKGKFCYTT